MREQFRVARRALDAAGLASTLRPGEKHPHLVVEAYGAVIAVPIASSPRCRRTAGLNTAKQIRRAVEAAATRAGVGP